MPILEIRARRFFTSEEADITPSVTLMLNIEKLPAPEKTLANLAEAILAQIDGLPATGVREMTREEVDAYIAHDDE